MDHHKAKKSRDALNLSRDLDECLVSQEVLALLENILIELIHEQVVCTAQGEPRKGETLDLLLLSLAYGCLALNDLVLRGFLESVLRLIDFADEAA